MSNAVGLSIFLIIAGFYAAQLISAELSGLLRGGPAERSIWLVSGGASAVVSGLFKHRSTEVEVREIIEPRGSSRTGFRH